MDFYRELRKDVELQEELCLTFKQAIKRLPEGRLYYKIMKGRIRYFRWDKKDKRQIYIRKKEQDMVFKLKYRRILEESVKTMEENLLLQKKLLQCYEAYDPLSCQKRLGKVYQDIPEEFFKLPKKEIQRKSYQNTIFSENLIHTTSFGMVFRSKSEALIAELLYRAGIPFTYETRLILMDEYGEKQYYYPDFTIILPNGETVYWEHCGRMDLSDYRQKIFKKLAVYHYNNIYPPKNLILTMDSKSGGIDIDCIQQIITQQLLPLFV